jgi:hypothetical protein
MNRPDDPDPSSLEPSSDPCSRCGRPVARVPLLYVGRDRADSGPSRVVCHSCLDRSAGWRGFRGFVGSFFHLLDLGSSYVQIAWLVIVLILAAMIYAFGNR